MRNMSFRGLALQGRSGAPPLADQLRENIPPCYARDRRAERFIRFIEDSDVPLDRALGAYRKTIEGVQQRTLKDGRVKQFRYAAQSVNILIAAAVDRLRYALDHSPNLLVAQKYAIEQNLKGQKKRLKINSIAVPEEKILSNEELNTLLAGIEDPVLACMARVLADTALRISEMLNILLTDIQPVNTHYRLRILGKGKKQRDIGIDREPIDRARELCQGKVYLFEKPDGKRYTRELVTMNLRNASMKIIGRAVGAHVFRHSLLSYLAKDGRIKAVANFAGHSSPATTLRLYVHDHYTYEETAELLRKRGEK